jgi:hypothetical protein
VQGVLPVAGLAAEGRGRANRAGKEAEQRAGGDAMMGWEKIKCRQFKVLERDRCPIVVYEQPQTDLRKAAVEQIKADIAALFPDEQAEVYKWMHEALNLRIYK